MAASAVNALIAFPNYADVTSVYAPVLSGGAWQTGAPLSNLQNRFLAYPARSVDCTTDATQGMIDLQTLRGIQVIVIPRHNLTTNAVVTFNLYDESMSLVSTNVVTVFPALYAPGSLPWGYPHFFDGKITQEEWALSLYPVPVLLTLQNSVLARYVSFSINDTANPAGYVQLNRIFIAPGWQPSVNFAFNSSLQVSDNTIETITLGTASIYDSRAKQRIFNLSFPYVPTNEMFANALDMEMRLGKSGQVFVSLSPTDAVNLARTSCICTMPTIDPLAYTFVNMHGTNFVFKEVVA